MNSPNLIAVNQLKSAVSVLEKDIKEELGNLEEKVEMLAVN